ncbi:hypothetical protein BST61_g4287 [Cercospora zeina]
MDEQACLAESCPLFWYFESRKDPANAPLVIWMNGGPGSSSMLGLLAGNGSCTVNSDSNSTTLNPWSWNNDAAGKTGL